MNGVVPLLILGGVVLVAAVSLVFNLKDPRNAKHPGGVRGRMRDELLVLSTFAPMLVMVIVGAVAGDMRDAAWWMPVFVTLAALAIGGTFLPAVQRARKRLMAVRGAPQ